MNKIKKYAVLISFLLLVLGALIAYLTNSYDISSQTISIVKDNNIRLIVDLDRYGKVLRNKDCLN